MYTGVDMGYVLPLGARVLNHKLLQMPWPGTTREWSHVGPNALDSHRVDPADQDEYMNGIGRRDLQSMKSRLMAATMSDSDLGHGLALGPGRTVECPDPRRLPCVCLRVLVAPYRPSTPLDVSARPAAE